MTASAWRVQAAGIHRRRLLMTTKLVRCLSMIVAMCMAGVAGCAVDEPDPAPRTTSELESAPELSLDELPANEAMVGGLCCITYTCPLDGFESVGCQGGMSSIGGAYVACDRACDVACESSVLECN
jgi:hypothetical protein